MKILHLEDTQLDHLLAQKSMRSSGAFCSWIRVDSLAAFIQECSIAEFDLVLADFQLPGFTAIDAWSAFPREITRPPFVLLSGAIGESAAVAAIKLGFADYLSKDDINKLPRIVERAIEFASNLRKKSEADEALAASKQRLSELNDHLQSIIELERKSIAREIHDDVGSALTAAKLDIAWLARRDLTPEMHSHAKTALDSLQSAIDACRRIMLNLRPSILDDGLQASLEWLSEGFMRRTGATATLRFEGQIDKNLDSDILLVSFRFVQEALANITKHAQCTAVNLEVSSRQGFLTLEVRDNGVGMTAQDQIKGESFGLRGLSERAQSIGGWMDVSSTPGHGVILTLTIPLHRDRSVEEEEDL